MGPVWFMVKKKEVRAVESGTCACKALMAIVIIVLVWVSTATWSRVVITVAAALILLGSSACPCKVGKKK